MICHVNGISLYYEVCGSGPPILLVHGNGESHKIFDVVVPKLREHFTVYAVDSRCHGQSDHPAQVSYDLMASDLIAMIRTLKLEKPIFYGYSDGGILGLLIAMREPQLLGKLIVSGANLNPAGMKRTTLWLSRLEALTGNKLARMMVREPRISPEALHLIAVPTVILAGEKDVIRPEHTRLIASHIPGSTLKILKGETHGSYIVHSEKLWPILRPYLL